MANNFVFGMYVPPMREKLTDDTPLNPTYNEIPVTAGVPIILGSSMNTDSVAADHVGSAFSSGTTVAGRVGQVLVKGGAAACRKSQDTM